MVTQKEKTASGEIFTRMSENDHEQVAFSYDPETGLKAIIAVHSTVLGPALGGTRMWTYNSDAEAINDVLRLSRGMTYKASISGLNLGGGKAVLIGGSKDDKSEALWRRYGKFVNSLNGKYITAEDVGTSTREMEFVALETDHVTGVPHYMGGSGDPSPVTAYGTFLGIKASAKKVYGNDSLGGKKIAVQGIGHVGEHLVKLLSDDGADLIITDIDEEKLKEVSDNFKCQVVGPDEIYDVPMDIYAPCALGATVNSETLNRLQCDIIAGAANNQLEDERLHGELVKEKGILYAPDFLINAGGLINVSMELYGYNRDRAYANTDKIYNRTLEIFEKAERENITTHEAALKLAEERIQAIAKVKSRM